MRKKKISTIDETSLEKKDLEKFKVILVAETYMVIDLEERGNYRINRLNDGSVKTGDFILVYEE